MLKLAALAYAPAAAVTFGLLIVTVLAIPGASRSFATAAGLYYGAALLSLLVAAPIAVLIARRMLTRREKRLLNAHAGVGR